MAKITRSTQKIFGGNAANDDIAAFGSMITGTPVYTDNIEDLQTTAYEEGWSAAIAANEAPFLEEMNGVQYGLSKQLAYTFQEGIPEYDAGTTYFIGSIVKTLNSNNVPILYYSLTDNNMGNPITDTTNWKEISFGGGSGLEVCDIGMALYIDESKGLRRYLNGQIVVNNTNTSAFVTKLLNIKALNPDYFTTEANWQAEAALNIDGCVYKFVINYDTDGTTVLSVRLPKYPDYVEIDSNSINNTAPVAVYGDGNGLRLCDRYPGGFYGYLGYSGQFASGSGVVGKAVGYGNVTTITNGKVPAGTVMNQALQGTNGAVLGVTPVNDGTSGLVGTATITSSFKSTKLKMRYFIQITTGVEEENIINNYEVANPYFYGYSIYSKTNPDNACWLQSSGQWNSGTVYTGVYEWAVTQLNNNVSGFKAAGDSTVADSDWVVDTANTQFRFPLKNGQEGMFLNGDIPVVGNGKTLGLTNGSDNFGMCTSNSAEQDVRMTNNLYGKNVGTSGSNGNNIGSIMGLGVVTSSNNSGLVAKVNTAVPSGWNLYYYIGNVLQNMHLINAGRFSEEIVDIKANLDGKWTKKVFQFINQQELTVNTIYTVDLSTVLPNDNNVYECSLNYNTASPSNVNGYIQLNVGGSILGAGIVLFERCKIEGSEIQTITNLIIPIGADRKITYIDRGTGGSKVFNATLMGYRKVR